MVSEPKRIPNSILQQEFPNTVILRGSLFNNQIALTFDDGPDIRYTPQVLDVLHAHQVKATFFLMGARAAEHTEIVKRIHSEGHAIGNHTYWHPNLTEVTLERAQWEFLSTDKILHQILGFQPRLIRPPYGALNREIVHLIEQIGSTSILWSVDSLDWRQLGSNAISDIILANTSPGSIILMHDGGDWTMDLSGTVSALHQVIPQLQQKGIQFVTIPELINISESK